MKKIYIIAWNSNTPLNVLGFDYDTEFWFSTKEEAQSFIDEENDDELYVYEVSEALYYVLTTLGQREVQAFTDNEDDLKKVVDFCENISDNEMRVEYLRECLDADVLSRSEWIDKKIKSLELLKEK